MSITTISNGPITASIDSLGAQLSSLKLDGGEYLWQADPRWWNRHAPVLFPIVGSIRGGRAESARGPVTLGRHGLARNYEHRVVDAADSSVTFELTDSSETLSNFPFPFRLNMTYAITGPATLTQTFRVENTGDAPLPFAVGGHPAFNVPVPGSDGEAFEDYELVFAEPWAFDSATIADGLFTYDTMNPIVKGSDRVPLSRSLFDYDTVMLEDVPGSTVSLVGTRSGHGVKVDFEGFKYLGIWSATGNAPFLAIEPWTGHATLTSEDDVFEHKRNIIELAPGAVDERSFDITLF